MMLCRGVFVIVVSIVLLALLPEYSSAQWNWECNDNGEPCGHASFATQGFIWAEKIQPPWQAVQIDSVKFAVYRYSGATETLTFKIHLYEDTAWLVSDSCLGDHGDSCHAMSSTTERWVSANLVTPSLTVNTPRWCTFNVPDCTFTRDFIIGIEVAQTGTAPSLMVDYQTAIPCCVNFYRYNNTWYEHYDLWMGGDAIGYNMICCRCFGWCAYPPMDVTILFNPDSARVELYWTGTGAPYFNIYRSLTDPFTDFTVIATTSETFYFDPLDADTMAFYCVTVSDGSQAMSASVHSSGDAMKATTRPHQLREAFPRSSP